MLREVDHGFQCCLIALQSLENSLIQSNFNLICFRLIGKLQKKKHVVILASRWIKRVSRFDFMSLYRDGKERQMRTQNIGFAQFLMLNTKTRSPLNGQICPEKMIGHRQW